MDRFRFVAIHTCTYKMQGLMHMYYCHVLLTSTILAERSKALRIPSSMVELVHKENNYSVSGRTNNLTLLCDKESLVLTTLV